MRKLVLLSIVFLLAGCTGEKKAEQQTVWTNTYDTVALLGFGDPKPLPAPKPGQITIRYGGWSLKQLSETLAGKQYFAYFDESWKDEDWSKATLPPGEYTYRKSESIPAVILASALLAYQVQKEHMAPHELKDDVLQLMADKYNHCNAMISPSEYVGFYWTTLKLYVDKEYCNILGGGVWEAKR
jgi:hypothetical protein